MSSHPISATAIVTHAPQDGRPQWRKEKIQVREPLEDEILVRMIATGICQSDITLSMMPEGMPGMPLYPKIMGHEGSGIVEKAGSKVTHVKEGDRVLLSFDYCGKAECRGCEDENPGYCDEFNARNFLSGHDVYKSEDGKLMTGLFFGQSSFSSFAIAKGVSALNVSHLVKDDEELKLLSPMGCGYQTGAGAAAECVNVGERDSIAVFGLGGVGMAAIMAAKIRGAKMIIGVDRVESRLKLAKELGATHVIDTTNFSSLAADLATAVREIIPKGINAAIDTTGVFPIIEAGIQSLQQKGVMVLIGIVNGEMKLDIGTIFVSGLTVRGCIEGNAKPSKFIPQMIEWYRQGKFPIEKLTKTYAAGDVEKALQDMRSGATIKPILMW